MSRLVLMRGLNKRAAGEDGPSFEEQFGTFANASIVDKFPQMDEERLAFQLIEKNDDNTEGVGAMVYQLGKSVVYVPAFFRNEHIDTGKIMFIANTQQFVPMSDPWIQYIREKDLQDPGELVEGTEKNTPGVPVDTARTYEWADPMTKSAALVTLNAVSRIGAGSGGEGIFGMALEMGKEASANLMDMLVEPPILNSALSFYPAEAIEAFAKKATALYEEVPETPDYEVVLPFTDEAKELDAEQSTRLGRDGFFMKRASTDNMPVVVPKEELENMFLIPTAPCRCKLITMDGNYKDAILLRRGDDFTMDMSGNDSYFPVAPADGPITKGDPGMTAARYMRVGSGIDGAFAYIDGRIAKIPPGAMALGTSIAKSIKLEDIGESIGSFKGKMFGGYDYGTSYFIMPDLTCVEFPYTKFRPTSDKEGWIVDNQLVTVGECPSQSTPLVTQDTTVLPKNTRVVYIPKPPKKQSEDGPATDSADPCDEAEQRTPAIVTMGTLPVFLQNFTAQHYKQVSIYSNGNDFGMSSKTASGKIGTMGDVMQEVIKEYAVSQDAARLMMKKASEGATPGNPKRRHFLIEKTAANTEDWEDSPLPMSIVTEKGPDVEQLEMPAIAGDPEKLKKAITSAAQKGIKEVFDVTMLKLLVKSTRLVDDVGRDLPTFMQTLDALCRELFRLSWHAEKFEKMYGATKVPQLKESVENAIESLSELTVFFKMRNKGRDDSDFTALTGQMS
jgi:hypothetical protein